MTDTRFWHHIRPNEMSRQPRRHVFLDCEAYRHTVRDGEDQRWALAVACFRSARPNRKPVEAWECFDDPEILWKAVDGWCGKSGRTVLWTHNLGYDARLSESLTCLPALGWTLAAHNLTPRGTWLVWHKGRATLCMVDSASVFPTRLDKVGETVRLGKLPLPPADAKGVGLYSRCWRDVEILREAVVQYLSWLDSADLGNWQLTGSGQAWSVYRHKFLDRRLLVHADEDALAAERRAMWTGRCEAFWRGEMRRQVVHEWDFELAYGRIAAQTAVPVRLLGPMPATFDWREVLDSRTTGLLAEVTVETQVPVVPTRVCGGILWPVGRFTTTLWDVEIAEALREGAKVTVHNGWLYRRAPALKAWAEWVISLIQEQGRSGEDWRYIVGKHWQRALIGRLAMSYTRWAEFATAPEHGVNSYPVLDWDTGERFQVVHIGQSVWRSEGAQEWEHSMPMVTGYVQAVGRVRLWRVLRAMPERAALYCDTDSVLVTDRHLRAMAAIAQEFADWGLRLKRSWDGFAVWGPRQIRTGAQVRVSGLPYHATQTGPTSFQGEVWESLQGALSHGRASRVHTRPRAWTITGRDHRRTGPTMGWTRPIELGAHHDREENPTAAGDGDDPLRHPGGPAGTGRATGVPGPARPVRPGDGGGGGTPEATPEVG